MVSSNRNLQAIQSHLKADSFEKDSLFSLPTTLCRGRTTGKNRYKLGPKEVYFAAPWLPGLLVTTHVTPAAQGDEQGESTTETGPANEGPQPQLSRTAMGHRSTGADGSWAVSRRTQELSKKGRGFRCLVLRLATGTLWPGSHAKMHRAPSHHCWGSGRFNPHSVQSKGNPRNQVTSSVNQLVKKIKRPLKLV